MRIHRGDCVRVLQKLAAASFDAVVTDPPYGIGILGREWDTLHHAPAARPRHQLAWTIEWASALLRVLKPGASLLVCMSPRTSHRVVSGIEDAGFEIRDVLLWIYGSAMPRGKWLDQDRTVNTTLRPSYEPILLARKPFDGTLQACYDRNGTGGLNIGAARLDEVMPVVVRPNRHGDLIRSGGEGRWPPNVAIDQEVAAEIDVQRPATARFFQCVKASTAERDAGLD